MDFWISVWISGFHSGFLDFSLDFWISGFQFGFLPTVYEISFVTDPSAHADDIRSLSQTTSATESQAATLISPTTMAYRSMTVRCRLLLS